MGGRSASHASLGASGGHDSLKNSSRWSTEQGVSDRISVPILRHRGWQIVKCFCPSHWTVDVHNSLKFDKELKAFSYLDKKQVTERQRRRARWLTGRIVHQAEKLRCLKDTKRHRKVASNYKCGGWRKRDRVRDRDRGRHK